MGQNPTKNLQSLPFAERVNFGFGNLSKLHDEYCKYGRKKININYNIIFYIYESIIN